MRSGEGRRNFRSHLGDRLGERRGVAVSGGGSGKQSVRSAEGGGGGIRFRPRFCPRRKETILHKILLVRRKKPLFRPATTWSVKLQKMKVDCLDVVCQRRWGVRLQTVPLSNGRIAAMTVLLATSTLSDDITASGHTAGIPMSEVIVSLRNCLAVLKKQVRR